MKMPLIFGYEARKVYGMRMFLLFLFITLFINGILFFTEQHGNNMILLRNYPAYQAFIIKYKNMSEKEAIHDLAQLKQQYDVFTQLQLMTTLRQQGDAYSTEIYNELMRNYPDIVKSYYKKTYKQISGDFIADSMIINKVYNEFLYIATYEEYLDKVDHQADVLSKFSIFSNDNSFSNNNIKKTAQDFYHFHGILLKYDNSDAVTNFVSYGMTDILVISMLILLCNVLIIYEKDRDLFFLLKANRYGRTHLILSKLLFLFINCVAISILFYGSNLLLAVNLYDGIGEVFRPIQSVPFFKQCILPINVVECLIIFFVLKAASLFTLCLVMVALLMNVKNTMISYTLTGMLLAASYAAYRFIGVVSYVNYFKFINIFSFLDAAGLLSVYQNLNFFGLPVGIQAVAFTTIPVLAITFSIAIICGFLRNMQLSITPLQKLFDFIKRGLSGIRLQHRLFFYELAKVAFTHKGIVVLLILLAYQCNAVFSSFVVFDKDSKVYQSYVQQWGGELTRETIAFVEQEQAYLRGIGTELIQWKAKYDAGNISQTEYEGIYTKLNHYLDKQSGFNKVYQQITDLQIVKERSGIQVWLLDTTGYNRLFAVESYSEDIRDCRRNCVNLRCQIK